MEAKQKRDRSKKTRPQSAQELVQALTDGCLDSRTRHAAAILEARGVISQAPDAAARALLVDALATWGVCQAAILAEVSRSRELVTDGALLPILSELQRVQTMVLKISSSLQALDDRATKSPRSGGKGKSKGDDGVVDISALFNDEVQP